VKSLLPFTVLALFTLGCAGKGTVTEGDRMVLDQTHKASMVALAALGGGVANVAGALVALDDIKLNMAQQLGVHGAPEKSVPYSPAASKAARDLSDKEHGSGWDWKTILLGIGGIAVSVAGAWFGMPWLSGVFPSLAGKWSTLAKVGVEATTLVRQQADMNDGKVDIKDVLKTMMAKQDAAGVQPLAAALAKQVEAELSILHNHDLPKGIPGE